MKPFTDVWGRPVLSPLERIAARNRQDEADEAECLCCGRNRCSCDARYEGERDG